jgi:benzoate-CoA ligase family protein
MAEPYNAADVILERAGRLRNKSAFIHSSGVTTYGEFSAIVNRSANALTALGVQRGNHVGLMLKDSPLYCAAFLGLVKAGAVAIPINPRLLPGDYASIIADAQIKLLLAERAYLPVLQRALTECGQLQIVLSEDAGQCFVALVAHAPETFAAAPTCREDPAFWLFSSGTTGSPKGIIHSHGNCAHAGKLLREALRADENSVILGTSKLFFAYGLDNAFLGPISLGATTVLDEEWPEPEQIVAQVERHRPDIFFSVPTFYRRLVSLGPERLAPLRDVANFYSAGERLPDAIAVAWRELVGKDMHVCYGMSETFCNAIAFAPGKQRLGATGVLLGDVQIRLLGGDGNEVAVGQPGVAWVKHPSLALGYSSQEATERSFSKGWFCTNDLFIRDAGGIYSYQGRADELLRIAGQWVKPAEVEEAVLADPRLLEAACVVVPDRDGFERLALYVVAAKPGEGQALASERCAEALPKHSRPKWIHELDELPKTPTGKVQRFKLRQLLLSELAKDS